MECFWSLSVTNNILSWWKWLSSTAVSLNWILTLKSRLATHSHPQTIQCHWSGETIMFNGVWIARYCLGRNKQNNSNTIRTKLTLHPCLNFPYKVCEPMLTTILDFLISCQNTSTWTWDFVVVYLGIAVCRQPILASCWDTTWCELHFVVTPSSRNTFAFAPTRDHLRKHGFIL